MKQIALVVKIAIFVALAVLSITVKAQQTPCVIPGTQASTPSVLFQNEVMPDGGIQLSVDPSAANSLGLSNNLVYSWKDIPTTLTLSPSGLLTGSFGPSVPTGQLTYVIDITDSTSNKSYTAKLHLNVEAGCTVNLHPGNNPISVMAGAKQGTISIVPTSASVTSMSDLDESGLTTNGSSVLLSNSRSGKLPAKVAYTYSDANGNSQAATVLFTVVDEGAISLTNVALNPVPSAPMSTAASSSTPATRVIVGWEQSGANSANSAGRLFSEVYFGHGLRSANHAVQKNASDGKKGIDGAQKSGNESSRWHIFGDVRIGSAAQNATTTVGSFVTGLSGTATSLKLNEIASVAEFLTGLEFSPVPSASERPFRFSIFAEYGATGNLQSAELNNIFAFPANTSQAYALLVAAEKNQRNSSHATTIPTTCVVGSSPKIQGVADNCMFVEFSQQQEYFDQEAYVGPRFVFFTPLTNSAPNVISVGVGANHAVNRNMDFNALRIDGLAPIPVPGASGGSEPSIPVFYLFGYVNLALNHSQFPNIHNFIPLDAASSVTVNGVPQTPSAENTYVIYTNPTAEEYYSIGVGVDLANIWTKILGAFVSSK